VRAAEYQVVQDRKVLVAEVVVYQETKQQQQKNKKKRFKHRYYL
jgi:hypothetical protein